MCRRSPARHAPVLRRSREIYFREPRGVLFEIATNGPRFAADEDPDHLGEELRLPKQHEHLRPQLEAPAAGRGGGSPRERARAPGAPGGWGAAGLLVLHHGRGADEHDLLGLADELLERGGLPIDYHESDAGHHIDPQHVPAAIDWLHTTLDG